MICQSKQPKDTHTQAAGIRTASMKIITQVCRHFNIVPCKQNVMCETCDVPLKFQANKTLYTLFGLLEMLEVRGE